MSINPATDLNLEELLQPAWAKEQDSKNPYAKYEPRERPDRGDRRDRPRGGGFARSRGDQRGGRSQGGGGERGKGPRRDFRGRDRSGPPDRRDPPPPPPEVNVALHAEDHGAESLARQIKTTGRAFPLFDIARMVLQKPDRYTVEFSVKHGSDGQTIQPLFVCALDETVWLSLDEAVAHVLQHHLATFYQTERTETSPPKGVYTFVAQCGMSGEIFGPPNHHDYQNKLREHHARRFSRLPFEVYKSRVKIVRDEAIVKQWIEEQSWKTEYVCLNVPEATRLADLAAVEAHFREVHLPTIISQAEHHTMPGVACQRLRGGLYRLYRDQMDQQRRFPMQIASSLSQQFASRGLQFFKVNKTVTHVWVARPTFLDLDSSPVSDGIRNIVQFIDAHPKCTRRQLLKELAPAPEVEPAPARATQDAAGAAALGQAQPDSAADSTPSAQPVAEQAPAAKSVGGPAPTPEQTAIISDLHWLVHQGHVIEFANGTLETAKKPVPRPAKATPKPPQSTKSPKAGTPKIQLTETPAAVETPDTQPTEASGEKVEDSTQPSSNEAETFEPKPTEVSSQGSEAFSESGSQAEAAAPIHEPPSGQVEPLEGSVSDSAPDDAADGQDASKISK